MWELDQRSLNAEEVMFWIMVLEKTLKRPLDSKEIKLVNSKENQPWIFTGRTDAESSRLWLPDGKSWLIGKDTDSGKDWRQEKKGVLEDEMVGWHHWLNGHEFEQIPGDAEGQGSLAYCIHGVAKIQMLFTNWTTTTEFTFQMFSNKNI